jgi:hypothetical protein
MLRPMANVSVANKALIKPSANKISVVSFKIGSKPVTVKTNIIKLIYILHSIGFGGLIEVIMKIMALQVATLRGPDNPVMR